MCSGCVSLAESLAVAAISVDKNGPKALVFMRAVAEDRQPKCPRGRFEEICHCLVQAAPFYTEPLAQLAQTLSNNESLAPLRDILRRELSTQMPVLRNRMYETTLGVMAKYPTPRTRMEDDWIAYLGKCFQYPALGQLVGEAVLEAFGLPESEEHSLRRERGMVKDGAQEWRDKVFTRALAAMKMGRGGGESVIQFEGSVPSSLENRALAPV